MTVHTLWESKGVAINMPWGRQSGLWGGSIQSRSCEEGICHARTLWWASRRENSNAITVEYPQGIGGSVTWLDPKVLSNGTEVDWVDFNQSKEIWFHLLSIYIMKNPQQQQQQQRYRPGILNELLTILNWEKMNYITLSVHRTICHFYT